MESLWLCLWQHRIKDIDFLFDLRLITTLNSKAIQQINTIALFVYQLYLLVNKQWKVHSLEKHNLKQNHSSFFLFNFPLKFYNEFVVWLLAKLIIGCSKYGRWTNKAVVDHGAQADCLTLRNHYPKLSLNLLLKTNDRQ